MPEAILVRLALGESCWYAFKKDVRYKNPFGKAVKTHVELGGTESENATKEKNFKEVCALCFDCRARNGLRNFRKRLAKNSLYHPSEQGISNAPDGSQKLEHPHILARREDLVVSWLSIVALYESRRNVVPFELWLPGRFDRTMYSIACASFSNNTNNKLKLYGYIEWKQRNSTVVNRPVIFDKFEVVYLLVSVTVTELCVILVQGESGTSHRREREAPNSVRMCERERVRWIPETKRSPSCPSCVRTRYLERAGQFEVKKENQ